jgi:tetratricopeptide (TPR) repeat protein
MPSPIGHALAGTAAGWLLQPPRASGSGNGARWLWTLVFALLGTAPDLDLLVGTHRGPTHSLAAAVMVGIGVWAVLRAGTGRPGRLATACAAAYGSHILIDWLGTDTSPPLGLLALWPFSTAYYQAPWQVFPAVSRRFGQPGLFWRPNTLALVRELLILVPVVAIVAWLRRSGRPRGSALVVFAAIGAGVITAIPGAVRPLAAASAQARAPEYAEQSNAYLRAIVLYLSGEFETALAVAATLTEADISDQAGKLKLDPRTTAGALMLHTELAFPQDPSAYEKIADFHLTRARRLLGDLRRTQKPGEFQRGWYLLASAELQGAMALNTAEEVLVEARSLFPRDPDLLLASAVALELRTFASSPQPVLQRFPTSSQIRVPDSGLDVRLTLESSARYLSEAVTIAPGHDEVRLRLGRVLHRLGQADRAADELEVVRRRAADPAFKYLAALFEGAVESSRQRPDRAEVLYQEALDVTPGQSAFVGLSEACYAQGRAADAARALEGAFRHPPVIDPWFAYLVGDGWHTASRLAAMRSLVARR